MLEFELERVFKILSFLFFGQSILHESFYLLNSSQQWFGLGSGDVNINEYIE